MELQGLLHDGVGDRDGVGETEAAASLEHDDDGEGKIFALGVADEPGVRAAVGDLCRTAISRFGKRLSV